jgi:hypothetical protein
LAANLFALPHELMAAEQTVIRPLGNYQIAKSQSQPTQYGKNKVENQAVGCTLRIRPGSEMQIPA